MKESQTLQNAMIGEGKTQHSNKNFEIKQWREQQDSNGRPLWRLKEIRNQEDILPLLAKFRIIYKVESVAFERDKKITLLAIVHRDEFDYEDGTTDLTKRILDDADGYSSSTDCH